MTTTTLQLKLDWRLVSAGLLIVIAVMVALWQPWRGVASRTVTVRGEATIEQAPDRFTFYASYQDTDKDKLTDKGNQVVAALKKLGVKSDDIQTSLSLAGTDGKETLIYPRMPYQSTYAVTLSVGTLELAQKVADYLATTNATGQITPQAGFSKATQAKLDLQARKLAGDDAKAKAQVSADQFGARLGRVTKITEDSGYGLYPADARSSAEVAKPTTDVASSPVLQPGTSQVTYVFTVVFELR